MKGSKWNRTKFGDIHSNIHILHQQLESVQQHSQPHDSSTLQVQQLEHEIEHWHQIQSEFWGQKARDQYYSEVDRNTKFHHTNANRRRSRNNIEALKDTNGNWCSNRDDLENLLVQHYSDLHTTSSPAKNEALLQKIPEVITSSDNQELVRVPEACEIWKALKEMKPWKAPEPDGFPPGFFHSHWDIVGTDVINMVRQFFQSGFILKELNNTNISLIPKTKNKQFPSDLRPIALCNTSYKIISKILSTRMKKVMHKIISPLQSAYVPGRQISDNVHLAQEIIHTMKSKKEKQNYLALKLDMSKAFDRIEWSFLMDVMERMGFCREWCNLILQCISTTKIFILINGAPCTSYKPSRGIRQGDPMSPYLFIIAMEALSRQLTFAEQEKKIEGLKIATGAPSISHLFFADDCLLFANADLHNVNNLLEIIQDFGAASGQVINFSKSSVFFSTNVPARFCRILSRRLKVPHMNPEERYLGMPLLIGKSKRRCFSNLLDKVKNRLSIYISKTMTQCSKSLMINTVTNTIPSYTMSCFQIPKETLKEISAAQRDFWWGFDEKRGTYVSSWKDLNLHKDIGGQGFRDLKILSKALLIRAAWRICTNSDAVWVKCMSAKYFSCTSMLHASKKSDCSWAWRGLQKNVDFIKKHSCWKIGDGSQVKIWLDVWVVGMDVPPTPRVEAHNNEEFIWVKDLINSATNDWNIDLVQFLFDQQTASLILQMRIPKFSSDKLIWKLTRNGAFTLKSTYKRLFENSMGARQVSLFIQGTSIKWKSFWSINTWPRVRHFFWKCLSEILPTRVRLSMQCNYINRTFPFCNQHDETTMHVIFHCPFSRAVWMEIPGGGRVLAISFNNIAAVFEDWFTYSHHQQSQSNWLNLAMVVAWSIWNERCDVVFEKKKADPRRTAKKAVSFANYLASITDKTLNTTVNVTSSSPPARWKPYECPFFTVNCDASFDSNTGLTGVGLVLRDFTGNWRGSFTKSYAGVADSERAECLAVYDAVVWCQSMQLSHVMIETDLQSIDGYINNRTSAIAWENEDILQDAMHIMKSLPYWKCRFIHRVCNKPADELAKFCRKYNLTQVWFEKPPSVIESLLLSDKLSLSD